LNQIGKGYEAQNLPLALRSARAPSHLARRLGFSSNAASFPVNHPLRVHGYSLASGRCKIIMGSEAAVRPRELHKRRQLVRPLDKSRRECKVSTTRLNGVFVLASDDLDSDSRTHS
jgi:hypothetical protein